MAIKFESVKAGYVLYECHKYRMGNTKMSKMGSWTVRVISVDYEKKTAVCSWNGNEARTYPASAIRRWRRTPHKDAK